MHTSPDYMMFTPNYPHPSCTATAKWYLTAPNNKSNVLSSVLVNVSACLSLHGRVCVCVGGGGGVVSWCVCVCWGGGLLAGPLNVFLERFFQFFSPTILRWTYLFTRESVWTWKVEA